MMVTGSSVLLFSPDGIIDAVTSANAPALSGPDATPVDPTTPNPLAQKPEEIAVTDSSEEEATEVKAFMKWAAKGKRARLFEFKSLDPIVGDALNRCAFDGDLETARALAKAYLT